MSCKIKIGMFLTLVMWMQMAFAQEIIPLNSAHVFKAVNQPGYTYSWWYVNAASDTSRFSSSTHQTESKVWATEGDYHLFVQVTDQNNCVSEIISKPFKVQKAVAPNTLLIALSDNAIGYSNSLITGNAGVNDFTEPDGNLELVYTADMAPVPGLVFNTDGTFSYMPPAGFSGKIVVPYTVCLKNQNTICASSEIIIRVLPNSGNGNIAPVASGDVYLTQINQSVTGNVLYNDIDPDGTRAQLLLTTSPVVEPAYGKVLILIDGSFSYTPDAGFAGTDKFMYRICDSGTPSLCDSAWVSIVVNNFGDNNTKPIPPGDDVFLSQKRILQDTLKNEQSLNGQQDIVFNIFPVNPPQHGTLQIKEDGSFTYIAKPDYVGIDYFVYEVCNTETPRICRKGTATIFIFESGTQLVNIAGNDTTISACSSLVLGGVVTDVSEYTFLWSPGNLLDNPALPKPVFSGGISTEFVLTLTDKNGIQIKDSVFVEVSMLSANAGEDLFMMRNQTTVLNGSKSSGSQLNFSWTTNSGKINSGANTPTPLVSGFGTYYLTVTDKFGCRATDSVTVQLLAQAPVAVDDYDTTAYSTETVIAVLANDTDPQNALKPETLTITIPPFNGSAYVDPANYTVRYKPNRNFSGKDNFEYRICNTYDMCDQATVHVMVSDFRFVIPEAFSPNGDNINDFFEIIGIEHFEGNSITIINRWGNKVYEARNYGIDTTPKFWDGTANTGFRVGSEALTSGTYFYVLDLGNGEKPIAGSIYLDR